MQQAGPNHQIKSWAASSWPNLVSDKSLVNSSSPSLPSIFGCTGVRLFWEARHWWLLSCLALRDWPDCASMCIFLWESLTFVTVRMRLNLRVANIESSLSTGWDSLVRKGCHMLHWAGSGFGLYLSAICPSSWASFSPLFPTVSHCPFPVY